MKKKRLHILLTIFLLVSSLGYAQNTVEQIKSKDLVEALGPERLLLKPRANNLQASTNFSNTNNIYIQQIGSDNAARIKIHAQNSEINLVQNGSNNSIRANIAAQSIIDNITQKGQNHHLTEFGNTPSLNIDRIVSQNGNSQNLTIHGNNSLSEKMQVKMEGNLNTIIIRNFN